MNKPKGARFRDAQVGAWYQGFGRLLQRARIAAGLTRERLADRVTDTAPDEISKLEAGEALCGSDRLEALASALGVLAADLLPPPPRIRLDPTGPLSAFLKAGDGLWRDGVKVLTAVRPSGKGFMLQARRGGCEFHTLTEIDAMLNGENPITVSRDGIVLLRDGQLTTEGEMTNEVSR